jgi:hypothetical protein
VNCFDLDAPDADLGQPIPEAEFVRRYRPSIDALQARRKMWESVSLAVIVTGFLSFGALVWSGGTWNLSARCDTHEVQP